MAECPAEALASSLPSGAKVVLAALWLRAGSGRRFVWPSRDTLSADVGGMSERQLRRNLNALEAERWIVSEKDQHGHVGWSLCDPPGNVVHAHESAPNATHNRPDIRVRAAAKGDRTSTTDRTQMSKKTDIHDRRILMEPTMNQKSHPLELPSPVESAEPRIETGATQPIGVNAWRSEFVMAWRGRFNIQACGWSVSDPTHGARRIPGLMDALEEHGPTLVSDVLLHAGEEVVRHHESGGRKDVGIQPGSLGCAFRSDLPTFPVLLDAWQAANRRKRVSGKLEASPAELDGVPLNDDDARAWMGAMGHDPEQAVRDSRAARAVEGDAVAMLDELAGSFAGVAG